MRVAHLLRKYNPSEWGGTETAIKRLCDDLRHQDVESVIFSPRIDFEPAPDPLAQAGHEMRCFRACVPVWGIAAEQRAQLIALGGNLLSFDLPWKLLREPDIAILHSHVLNRLGGIALTIAQLRRIPLVVSIHGGLLNLPEAAKEFLAAPLRGGYEWGKVFGALLRSRKVIHHADAILTFNKTEQQLLALQHPTKRIILQPHGVPVKDYEKNCREAAIQAFPVLAGKTVLLIAGRIDPVKNQLWAVSQMHCVFQQNPNLVLVLAGGASNRAYADSIRRHIRQTGMDNRVLMTGGLPASDPRLIGLFQLARALVLPSITETFGLVILEAWAAGNPVISSRNPGALDLVNPGENGWLFDLQKPPTFQTALQDVLAAPGLARRLGLAGQAFVKNHYDSAMLAGSVKRIYQELIELHRQKKRSAV